MRLPSTPIRILLSVCSGVLLIGCQLSGQDRLESSLRRNEASLRDLNRQLSDAQKQLRDQENELQVLRQPAAESPFHSASSARTLEAEVAWGAVEELRIHPLASGILREPDGSLLLSAIVQPVDHDMEVLKVSGQLDVQVQVPGAPELLKEARLTPLESRAAWGNGIVARGFQVEIPLPAEQAESLQAGSKVLITATLSLTDDRQFKATQLVRMPNE